MIHEPGSVHACLRTTADDAWRLYCALEQEIPERQAKGFDLARPSYQRRSAASSPWNSVAAELTIEFHRKIRAFESTLNERVVGATKHRGPSHTNTWHAINGVVNLCETIDKADVLGVLNYLTHWVRRAHTYFDPAKGLHRLPRNPGEKEHRCPYCQNKTMRWSPTRGKAVCILPTCENDLGMRPQWFAEFDIIGEQLIFRWDEEAA